jgi:aspartate aminotransferase-like enzyme
MMSERARAAIETTTSTSFACDLRKWLSIAETYESGAIAYHATMPTDALAVLRDVMVETRAIGFAKLKEAQIELGRQARALLASKGFPSVAAEGYGAPGVIVSYTDDAQIQSGAKLKAQGLQIAAGVPLQCDEGPDFRTFRIGLFGLDKLGNVPRTVEHLDRALSHIV